MVSSFWPCRFSMGRLWQKILSRGICGVSRAGGHGKMGMGWLGNRGPVTKIDPILFKDRTRKHASTCTHTSTRSNSPGQKERKKIGDFGLVNVNFCHQKTKSLQYKHLFKTLAQTVTNKKNLKTFISFDSKELTYFYRNFTEKNKKMWKIGD